MGSTDPTWDFRDPASRERVLGVLRREMDEMLEMVADPAVWEAPTACDGWDVRDVVGHLIDATEGYLPAFAAARTGATVAEPLGLQVMATRTDEQARSFRKVPQQELLGRLRDDITLLTGEFQNVPDDQWATFLVPHPYMGPVPASFYAEFQLVDYAVHGWDVREGSGQPHALHGDSADLLAPLIYILWGATADVSRVDEPYSVGIRTSGHNGGDVRADVSPEGVQIAPGNVDDCPAILEFDPATLVLTGYGRMNGGTVRGDRQLATDFLGLFFRI
jgi:uncharacterized protein (TIGR03083 family)